ncbi:MAG: Ig-like domain-containing protein [Comamonadaceae bacterium]
MKSIKFVAVLVVAVALAACGGGGGSARAPVTTSTTPTPTTAAAASLVLSLDKTSVKNTGSDKALLTVTALNAARNVVSGLPLSVSVDSGVYTPVVSTTDSAGQASGNISIGSEKANRNITVTIMLGGQTGSVVVAVTGSQISLTPLPATPAPGASVQLAVKTTDANGTAVGGVSVQLGGTLGFTQLITTNSDGTGTATATLGAAPATAATYTVTAAGLGVTASRDVQVVSGVGAIPAAVGTINGASLAITPTTISPNLAGATTNRANIRATFFNAANQPIQNVRARFEIVSPALDSYESISTGTATVYSDVSGVAIADYIAGTRTSPTNGVIIRICYGNTDIDIAAGACPSQTSKTLTVAGQPLSITLGDNNELTKGANNLTYIKKFDVAVNDSAGIAVANAIVSASVDLTHFGKGGFNFASSTGGIYQVSGSNPPPAVINGISDGIVDVNGDPVTGVDPTLTTGRVWCPNEDKNRNGLLDAGEDHDNNGALSPRKADVVLSFVGTTNTTGANGRATIQVEYPQNVATWLTYAVTVTTGVSGSEGSAVKSYITSFVKGDEINGSFLTPAYGVNNCWTKD